MSFLKAEWRKLAIVNYTIDEKILVPLLPPGTELDLWKGKCYLSLLGFMFLNTKVLGVRIPFHVNFEEVNLRFYVKRLENGAYKRGVVFIKEIVPKRAVTFIANNFYKENYETLPMEHSWDTDNRQRTFEYKWKKKGHWNSIKLEASLEKYPLEANSETEFITEHYWGYAKINESQSHEYEVTHPRWEIYKVYDYALNVDYAAVYGQKFAFLNSREPSSVMAAEGSAITVENKKVIS